MFPFGVRVGDRAVAAARKSGLSRTLWRASTKAPSYAEGTGVRTASKTLLGFGRLHSSNSPIDRFQRLSAREPRTRTRFCPPGKGTGSLHPNSQPAAAFSRSHSPTVVINASHPD